jgi:predicted PurR-regulated permease PerM
VQAERREIVFGRGLYWALGVVAVGFVLYWLREVLTPIFLAFAIAYMLDPVVDRLEKWRIPRGAAIALVLLGFLVAVGTFLLLVVPEIVRDVTGVVRELPDHAKHALERLEPWLARQGVAVPHTADEWVAKLKERASGLSASALAPVGDALKAVIGGTASVFGAVVGALIVPILAVYLLADFDRMVAAIDELIPLRYRATVESYARDIDTALSQFMRGQLTVMAILAVLYGGSYWLLGVRLAIPIGIAAGILNFVPYVGSAFALVAGLLMALIGGGGWGQIAGVVIAYAVVQTLEGFVITPRIVGESIGLKEIWVLLAIFVAGEIFGFLGVLLAVPATAVLKIFVTRAVARYRASTLFLTPADALVEAGVPVAEVEPEPPLEVALDSPADAEPPSSEPPDAGEPPSSDDDPDSEV